MRVLILIAVVLLVPILTPGPPVAAAEVWRTQFDASVRGDVTVVGNAVLTCPTPEQAGPSPKYPPQSCVDAQNRVGGGPSAMNNGHRMSWTDVDGDPATFNSSSARIAIPAGATVAYAKLGWAGNTKCDSGVTPPGTPPDQTVSLRVGGTTTRIGPDRFAYAADSPDDLAHTDHGFYSAEADVTREVTGSADVVVGNVWTPQGFDCFGGWSLTVVWKSEQAPRRHVSVHGGHVRLTTRLPLLRTPIAPTHAAGGTPKVGLTAYEGDWATSGDGLQVDGTQVGDDNLFVSSAHGAAIPSAPNNMSVDARVLPIPAEALKPGRKSAELTFRRTEDAFLAQSVVWSFPLPDLTLGVTPAEPAAHPRETVAQTATVTNTGDAPAADVTVCDQAIGTLAAKEKATRTCTSVAADNDYQTTVAVRGTSLAGDPLTATTTSPVDVLHPAMKATTPTGPVTALPRQAVKFTATVTNTGDTPLLDLVARTRSDGGCAPVQAPRINPGETSTVDCTAAAGDESGDVVATLVATDRIGGKVETTATVAVRVIYPRLTIAAVWSKDRAEDGELVTVTVTVGNPSDLPINDVRVGGTPEACQRTFPVLAPQQRITYTCQVTAPVDSRLTISGAGAGLAVSESAVVRIASFSAPLPQLQPDPPAPAPLQPRPIAHVEETSKPATGGMVAVLAVVGMLVVSSLSGIGKR